MPKMTSEAFDRVVVASDFYSAISQKILAITMWMERIPAEELQALSYASFSRIIHENGPVSDTTIAAVHALAEPHRDILVRHVLVETGDGGEAEIPLEEYQEAVLHGASAVIHPETGLAVSIDAVYFSFSVSPAFYSNIEGTEKEAAMIDDKDRPHTITGDDVPPEAPPVPAEEVEKPQTPKDSDA